MTGSLFGVVMVLGLPAVYVAFVAWIVASRHPERHPERSTKNAIRLVFTSLATGAFVIGLIARFFLSSRLFIRLPWYLLALVAIAVGWIGVALAQRGPSASPLAAESDRPRGGAHVGNGKDVGNTGSEKVVAAEVDVDWLHDTSRPNAARVHKVAGRVTRTVLVILNIVTVLACALTWLAWPVLPDGRLDNDAVTATFALVVFVAFVAMFTGVVTGIAIRMQYVAKRWITIPTALLILAVTIGVLISVVASNYPVDDHGFIPVNSGSITA